MPGSSTVSSSNTGTSSGGSGAGSSGMTMGSSSLAGGSSGSAATSMASSSGVLTATPDPLVRTLSDGAAPQASFVLPAGSPAGATFACAVDAQVMAPCVSPYAVPGLAMHQHATVHVQATLPGLPPSNVVSQVVRRGFARRGVGGGAPYTLVPTPQGDWMVTGSMRGVELEVATRLYAPLTSDGSFDTSRVGLVSGGYGASSEGVINVVTPQLDGTGAPTGKVWLAGNLEQFNGVDVANNLLRVDEDGALDTTFTPVDVGGRSDRVNVVVQELGTNGLPTGKLLVGGGFQTVAANTAYSGLVRLTASGAVDPSWPANGGFDDEVDVVLQLRDAAGAPTGKMLVGGTFTQYAGSPVHAGLVMLREDGSLEAGFAAGNTGFDRWVGALLQLRDAQGAYTNRVAVGGAFSERNALDVPDRLVVVDFTGALDPTFNPGGSGIEAYSYHGVHALMEDVDSTGLPTGKLWVGGEFWEYYNGQYRDGNLFVVNANGSLDPSRTAYVSGRVDALVPVRAANGTLDGRVWVVGNHSNVNGLAWSGVALLDAAMMLDPAFKPQGLVEWDNGGPRAAAQRRDVTTGAWTQELHLGGGFVAYGSPGMARHFLKLGGNGQWDTTFNLAQTPGFDRPVNRATAELNTDGTPTGAWIVAGSIYRFNGQSIPMGIARVTAAGSRDATFNAGGGGLEGYEDGYVVEPARDAQGNPTGALWVGTPAVDYNTNAIPGGLFRIQANGRRDATYNPSQGFGTTEPGVRPYVGAIVPERAVGTGAFTGKMWVTGRFDLFNGAPIPNGLARLNVDGTPDATFNVGGTGMAGMEAYLDGVVQELDATGQPNGRLVVFGRFETFNGVARGAVVRLLADGTVDTSFGPVGFNLDRTVHAVLQERNAAGLPTGNWFLGGYFGSILSGTINVPDNFLRVTAQGEWDPTFNTDAPGFDGPVYDLQAERRGGVFTGRILAVGEFRSYNLVPRLRVAAVDAQGNPDEYFQGQGRGP